MGVKTAAEILTLWRGSWSCFLLWSGSYRLALFEPDLLKIPAKFFRNFADFLLFGDCAESRGLRRGIWMLLRMSWWWRKLFERDRIQNFFLRDWDVILYLGCFWEWGNDGESCGQDHSGMIEDSSWTNKNHDFNDDHDDLYDDNDGLILYSDDYLREVRWPPQDRSCCKPRLRTIVWKVDVMQTMSSYWVWGHAIRLFNLIYDER